MSSTSTPIVWEAVKDASRVGLACGSAGFLVGGTAGILKNTTPFLFGAASFIQCGCLGSTFWLFRTELLRARKDESTSATTISALAGAMSGGGTAQIFRGYRNVLPAIVCFATFGAVGQMLYDRFAQKKEAKPTILERLTTAKWSPLQSISDEQYIKMLREQLLKNQVEIAVLDDKIAALKQEAKQPVQVSKEGHSTS